MTEFILIRHGKPDYTKIEEKGFIGHGCDLAFLSDQGIQQANEVAHNEILKNSEILLSSPYTRCMQTASIISNQVNIPITGEIDLHEWLPDLTYTYNNSNVVKNNYRRAIDDYASNQVTSKEYESIYSVQIRLLKTLKKYLMYQKVIVVTHGGVMYSITGKHCPHCGIEQIKYDGKILIK